MESCTPVYSDCMQHMKGIQDALEMFNGKWKIRIMAALTFGPKRFTDLQLIIEGIGTKMLSKELQLLELNGLIRRDVIASKPVSVNYAITDYGLTVGPVIKELSHWGNTHRKQIMGKV
ncbi:winged helix-turn-helix transcriptional regulator [Chitinophaga sancti]|uniref:Helix-turn-helix domain-containing protein n=1 Tax=Chitinophaga sancti TaxID=1004 RepID=A0A1K1RPF9_9BACT|nr:helix-turn-helix domain-containing protein [Chitinophaga sancti]WQD62591.1 helix-turn-helix domain-containing protein [Chitinophaga sancti]WQG91840.1 helix-turn-helix domain-containing protein [Chitinophaga sancti]SFW73692.1 transcriptional regulator, HxlR family [Chitinophaga sancti]